MNAELVVIAGQLYRGEYVLRSCTQIKARLAANITKWLKSTLRSQKIDRLDHRKIPARGSEAKNRLIKIMK